MLILLIVICVLIGLAYADYCLVDNAAHFGITFRRLEELEEAEHGFGARLAHVASVERSTDDDLARHDDDPVAESGGGTVDLVPSRAVDSLEHAARQRVVRPERPGWKSPLHRPGSRDTMSGEFPIRPSAEPGVASIGI